MTKQQTHDEAYAREALEDDAYRDVHELTSKEIAAVRKALFASGPVSAACVEEMMGAFRKTIADARRHILIMRLCVEVEGASLTFAQSEWDVDAPDHVCPECASKSTTH